ncbi:MAG: ornithine cyclodeaminase family protein [Thaumarchaeota archaeon]|nr:ornithine cyclodeaminase family protein [Nitrososphaerota archaeon]
MDVLFLSSEEIQCLIGLDEGIELADESFRLHYQGKVLLAQRVRQYAPKRHGSVMLQGAFVDDAEDILVAKISGGFPENPAKFNVPSVSGLVIYFEPGTGLPMGIFDSTYISAVRTSGNGALGVKHLSREDSRIIGVIGSGVQARAGLAATLKVRLRIEKAYVYSPNKQHREAFAETMTSTLGIEVAAANSSQEAVKEADIVYLATYAKEPVIQCGWLKPGTHVSSVGYQDEIDLDFFNRAKVVVSDIKSMVETGRMADALKQGLISERSIYASMGELVAGVKKGRTSREEITLYIATGMAVQDAVASRVVYERAIQRSIGRKFSYTPYGAF